MKHSKLNGLTGTIACFPLLAKSVALHRLIYLFKESRTAAEAEFSKDEINLKHSDASPHSQHSLDQHSLGQHSLGQHSLGQALRCQSPQPAINWQRIALLLALAQNASAHTAFDRYVAVDLVIVSSLGLS